MSDITQMDGDVPAASQSTERCKITSFQHTIKKKLRAMKALRSVKRITFRSEAGPGDTLNVHMPKLNQNRGPRAWLASPSLWHRPFWRARQQLSRPELERVAGSCEPAGCNVWRHYIRHYGLWCIQDIHWPILAGRKAWQHGAWGHPERIFVQDTLRLGRQRNLCRWRQTEREIYGKKYRINLDHQILTDHGIFYPQDLYNDLEIQPITACEHDIKKVWRSH